MFIVESGRCEVYVEESPGHTITIALMGPDDFFGEMALISEETRTASVRALEDCRLLTLDRKTLYETVPAESDALIELTKLVEQRKDTLPNLIARARMVAPEQAASTVAVYSPKGGSGRTTIAVNSAAALARRFPGEVLLVDLALPYNHAALISYLTPTGCLAAASQVPPANFEEAVLGAILHHPGGMMLLPGVLRAEQADLITVDLVNRAMGILVNAFRYIVFDLGVAFTDIVISVLDHSQRVLVLVTPELSSLKDVGAAEHLHQRPQHRARPRHPGPQQQGAEVGRQQRGCGPDPQAGAGGGDRLRRDQARRGRGQRRDPGPDRPQERDRARG